jgi:hypothetical protein
MKHLQRLILEREIEDTSYTSYCTSAGQADQDSEWASDSEAEPKSSVVELPTAGSR